RAPSRSDPNIATRQEHHTNHDTRKAGADTMNKTIITALALGIIGSGAAYYVWCSLQWKENAEKARASTSVESEGATAANEAEYAADEPQPGTAAPTTPTPIDPIATDRTVVAKPEPKTSISQSGALLVEARMGQRAVFTGRDATVHMMLTARGAADAVSTDSAVNLVLVLDRSGSMKGDRMDHARASAKFLIDQLKNGDRVAVVSYNTKATVDVESTVV